jgi:hypothetical protein
MLHRIALYVPDKVLLALAQLPYRSNSVIHQESLLLIGLPLSITDYLRDDKLEVKYLKLMEAVAIALYLLDYTNYNFPEERLKKIQEDIIKYYGTREDKNER